MTTRTYTPRQSEIERRWFVVDASGQTLGRVATQVAGLLAGKHKPTYASHLDTGDHVIVINAARVTIKGDMNAKVYARHSGYPGGFRSETLAELLDRRPEEVVRRAVKGMLPRNRLGVQQLRKLKVYAAAEHPHEAQLPAAVTDAANALIEATTIAPETPKHREPATRKPKAKAAAPVVDEIAATETAAPEVGAAQTAEQPATADAAAAEAAAAEPATAQAAPAEPDTAVGPTLAAEPGEPAETDAMAAEAAAAEAEAAAADAARAEAEDTTQTEPAESESGDSAPQEGTDEGETPA